VHGYLVFCEVTLPLIALGHGFNHRISGLEKGPEVADKEKVVCHATEETQRRMEVEHIAHDGDVTALSEEVIVIEALENSVNH
jgi:hypothetical protein